MIEEPTVGCPYCGEAITIVVDITAGSQRYVEDCFVCCQPIDLAIEIEPGGEIGSIDAQPENG